MNKRERVLAALYSVPALTTVDPNIRDYAEHAVGMLIERIEGYEGPARSYVTDYTLVERATASFVGGVSPVA